MVQLLRALILWPGTSVAQEATGPTAFGITSGVLIGIGGMIAIILLVIVFVRYWGSWWPKLK
jgi:hypothetical protein